MVFIDLWPYLLTTKLCYAQLFKWGHSNMPICNPIFVTFSMILFYMGVVIFSYVTYLQFQIKCQGSMTTYFYCILDTYYKLIGRSVLDCLINNWYTIYSTRKYEKLWQQSTISDRLEYWTNLLMTFFSKRQKMICSIFSFLIPPSFTFKVFLIKSFGGPFLWNKIWSPILLLVISTYYRMSHRYWANFST